MELDDPYEVRLYQMFKSCDTQTSGFLNGAGLRQLCSLLELADNGKVLIDDLLHSVEGNSKEAQISYENFKQALLNFLGGASDTNTETTTTTTTSQYQSLGLVSEDMQQKRSLVISDVESVKPFIEGLPASSDREVSPKLIVGTKKYGRRSRPQQYFSDENSLSDSDENESSIGESKTENNKVERSSSQTDIPSNRRRRRTIEKGGSSLKRCTSLPAQRDSLMARSKPFSKPKSTKINVQSLKSADAANADDNMQKPLSSSVESLGHHTEILSTTIREVWNNYSDEVGSSYLTCTQLRNVCERLGLQTVLAERVAIESFDQLHTSSSCQYNQLISVHDFIKLLTGISSSATDEDQSKTAVMHEISDSNKLAFKVDTSAHMETLSKQDILDIWERSGISNGASILSALGFDDNEVHLPNLYKIIEEEVRSLEEEQSTNLLRASLALQTIELTSVRQMLRQMHDENTKLRADNKEANRRVTMLAMEIDERHASIEENAKKEVLAMEQRHSNVVRELTARMASDRENWNNLITKLESRIKCFEQDEIRLKTELELVHKENEELENEQQNLQKQITEVLEQNIKLNREIAELTDASAQCPHVSLEHRYKDENAGSDDNVSNEDEILQLVEKLASLQLENHKLRDKNDELVMEVENLNLELQRYKSENKNKRSSIVLSPCVQPESIDIGGGIEELDCAASISLATKRRGDSPSKTHVTEESPRTGKLRKCASEVDLQSGEESSQNGECVVALNQELLQEEHSKDSVPDVVACLRRRVEELETLLKSQKSSETEMDGGDGGDGDEKCDPKKIMERCKELETSLEQMQVAYEDCEDYWQAKLEEERKIYEKQRQLYEDDQLESDRKFTELMEKVREYEEQFSKDGRLSPIEEKDLLEQQYLQLEAELKAEREKSECAVEDKNKEIESLQREINSLHREIENLHTRLGEIVTDACDFSNKAAAAIVSQRESNGSAASSPINYLWHQSTIQEPAKLLENLSTATATEEFGTQSSQTKNLNLSTTELSTFSTPPTSAGTPPPAQQNSISPIQKPSPKSSQQSETDENGAVADCDTTSTVSGKSFDSKSLVSIQSEKQRRRSAQNADNADGTTTTQCITPTRVVDEIKRLKFLENSLKDQIKDLSFQRDGLVMELQQLQEARPVLEKAYTRTAHPSLTQRISQLELKNRHLQNVIKQQQQYSESIMQQSWRQYQTEMNELHGRLDAQVAMITEQGQRLQNADMLVKDLYVENAHLSASVQRLEQQRFRVTMMQQQQQQHMNQVKGLNIIPGMP